MSPGLLGTELAATPPQYMQTTMEDKFFPPISRKSAISLGSETDSSDYSSSHDRKTHTRGSVPASLSSSPVKFPTIDRANSTSIASLPGSRATRHRSKGRDLRSSYCRSPSCPSNLDISRDFSRVDFALFKRDTRMDSDLCQPESPTNDTSEKDYKSKLPNIFSKDYNAHIDSSKKASRHDKARDQKNTLSLRRSESYMNALSSTPANQVGSLTSRETSQRQGQSTALLLPIRTDAQVSSRKKKNKRQTRVHSDSEFESDTHENTPRNNFDSEDSSVRRRFTHENEDTLETVARENDINNEGDSNTPTPRAIEINASRKVKQWMKSTRAAQKEGEVKA